MNGNICDYGCGQEANFKLKNGKYCCSDSHNKCPNMKKKNSFGNKGKKFSNERKENISNGLKGRKLTLEHKQKLSKSHIGKTPWNKGIPCSDKTKQKISRGNTGKTVTKSTRIKLSETLKGVQKSKEHRKRISEARMGKYTGKDNPFYGKKHTKETIKKMVSHPNRIEFYKKQKEYMINGGASYLNSCISNPSKPQVELYNMILELCPYAILNYPCLNYSIDIAIPFLNIAIEYDEPYWHQDKESDERRQKKLEEEGWIFIRFETLPKKENLYEFFRIY